MNFDKLDKVALFNIAVMLDLDNLLSFCNSSNRINRLICQDKNIWLSKLVKEFPDWKQLNMEPRRSSELLVALTKLKKIFNYRRSVYELYKETRLDLSGKGLTVLPSEISNLSQLQILILSGNQITSLPPEIGELSNLRTLSLFNNQITSLPPEIGQLTRLEFLYTYGNQITTLPIEIGKLSNLRILSLDKNVIIPIGLKLNKRVIRYV